jgi:hypothetical protein
MRIRTITRIIIGDPAGVVAGAAVGVVLGDIPAGEVAGEGGENDGINYA